MWKWGRKALHKEEAVSLFLKTVPQQKGEWNDKYYDYKGAVDTPLYLKWSTATGLIAGATGTGKTAP